jgi:hypothetical protein
MRKPLFVLALSVLAGAAAQVSAAPTGKIRICQLDAPQAPASATLPKDQMFGAMDGASRMTGKISAIFLSAPVVIARGKCVVADAVNRPFHGMSGKVPVKDEVFRELNGTASATVMANFR